VRRALEAQGYAVLEVRGDGDALQAFYRHRPRMLVFDVALTTDGALSICKMLKDDPRAQCVPALVLSARVNPAAVRAAAAAGADTFMSKPFSSTALLSTIRRLIGASAAA
jgi:CheY-like chemotaxis protein